MKEKLNQPINFSITPGSVIQILFILLVAYLIFIVRDLVLVIIASIVLASAIEPITKWLQSKRLPRAIAVIIIYVAALSLMAFLITSFLPPLVSDIREISNTLPQYIESFSDESSGFSSLLNQVGQSGGSIMDQISNLSGNAAQSFLSTASSIFGGLMSFVLIVVISFYLAVQKDGVGNFLRIVTPVKHEKYVIDLWKRSQRKIGFWMQGQLLLGVIVGVLTYLGLMILGVKNAFLLAILAGVFELIPVFGPTLSAIPAIMIAFVQDGFVLALIVAGLFVIIQQFENQLIQPLVVKKMVGIPALVAIISLIIGAQIAGFLGMLIAVPITAALMEYLSDIEKAKLKKMKELGDD